MEQDDAQHADKSQWLPLKEVRKYAEFAKEHGRKIWNNGMILPSKYDKLPIERLAEDENILTEDHKRAGLSFRVLWDCAEGRVSALNSTDSETPSRIEAAIRKIAIESQLNATNTHLIRRVLVYPIMESDYAQFHRIAGNLQSAFDALIEAMQKDNVQKAIDRRHERAIIPSRSRHHKYAQKPPEVMYI